MKKTPNIVNLSRNWDSRDVWGVIRGDKKTVAQFRAETGGAEDNFKNTGCLSMVPELRGEKQPWMGSTTFFKGWWFAPDGTKDMGGSWHYDASKDVPTAVSKYIRAAYEAGINPLPHLRKELPQITWEYVSNSRFVRRATTDSYNQEFIQPVGSPVCLVAWDGNDFRNQLAIANWDGKKWYGDFGDTMLPRLHGPKAAPVNMLP
jgi:hypothetical protein